MQPPYPAYREELAALIEARRQSHPHVVRQRGLLRGKMHGDESLRQFGERRTWLDENCRGTFWVDDLKERGVEVGKLYRFAQQTDADWFRYRF